MTLLLFTRQGCCLCEGLEEKLRALFDVALEVLPGLTAEALTEGVGVELRRRRADDGELLGQQVTPGEVVERGEELAHREVARRAEDHERGRWADLLLPPRGDGGAAADPA